MMEAKKCTKNASVCIWVVKKWWGRETGESKREVFDSVESNAKSKERKNTWSSRFLSAHTLLRFGYQWSVIDNHQPNWQLRLPFDDLSTKWHWNGPIIELNSTFIGLSFPIAHFVCPVFGTDKYFSLWQMTKMNTCNARHRKMRAQNEFNGFGIWITKNISESRFNHLRLTQMCVWSIEKTKRSA